MIILIGEKYMSWIKDVKDELKNLDVSQRKLKNFGLLIGIIFLALAAWIYLIVNGSVILSILFTLVGVYLLAGGLLFSSSLKTSYKLWMGLALALGWIMSRVLLTLLFYLVVTPLALMARLFKKEFLDLNYNKKRNSYWVLKKRSEINYKKMY